MTKSDGPTKRGTTRRGVAKAAPIAKQDAPEVEDTPEAEVEDANGAADDTAVQGVNPAMVPPPGVPVEDNDGKAQIEMTTCISFPHGTYNAGQVIELETAQAQRYVDTGQAKPVKA